MKKLASWILAIALVLGVLVLVKADVNHGHGPGVHAEGGQSEESNGHGGAAESH